MSAVDDCANPLLLGWVKEWLDQARERNTKGVTTFRHAYDSLKACPITFQHPQQLQQLRGFGPKLCDRLTDKLKDHCARNGLPTPKKPRGVAKNARGLADEDDPDGEAASRPAKKPRTAKPYVPAYRSGAYAIVLALATQDEDSRVGLTKAEIVEEAEQHCDSSFKAPSDPTKFYTAWNSMKTLQDKDMVYEKGRPLRRYYLTEEGWEVARRIFRANEQRGIRTGIPSGIALRLEGQAGENGPLSRAAPAAFVDTEPPEPRQEANAYQDVVADGESMSNSAALPTFTPLQLVPGSFSVHLLLDVREVRAKTDRDYMQEELAKQGVKPIMRSLELGDAQWVAKCHDPNALSALGAEGDEIVLDWIVERKRLDDLVASIKDGRFHEQKFRLRRSGIKNVIYIIEEIAMDGQHFQKYEEAVQSAIASTQVVHGYFVKKTQKMDETIRYLARMTAMLKKMYEARTLNVVPTRVLTTQSYLPLLQSLRQREPETGYYVSYPAFASLASKSEAMTLRDVFLKMLMTTRGVTGEKAIEIQKCWRTPHDLVRAFESCGGGEAGKKRKRELVAARLGHLVGRKKIAKAVSERIAEVWGDA